MSRTLRRVGPITIVVAINLALVLAGCGSSGASHAAGTKQLIAQADPICKEIAAKREAANAALHGASLTTMVELARLAPTVAAVEHEAVKRLHALQAPAAVSAEWQKILSGMQTLADDTTQLGVDAKAKDVKKVESISASGRHVREQLAPIAEHVGFKYCGTTS
jgi:hypothetical protein